MFTHFVSFEKQVENLGRFDAEDSLEYVISVQYHNVLEYQLLRLINKSRMTKYKECLLDTNWSILDVYDAYKSYISSFMNIFKYIYNDTKQVTQNLPKASQK